MNKKNEAVVTSFSLKLFKGVMWCGPFRKGWCKYYTVFYKDFVAEARFVANEARGLIRTSWQGRVWMVCFEGPRTALSFKRRATQEIRKLWASLQHD